MNSIQHYKEQFSRFHNGSARQSVHTLREKALNILEEEGFPTVRQEEWRFTNIKPIVQTPFMPAEKIELAEETIAPYLPENNDSPRIVLINGRFDAGLSKGWRDIPGVEVISIKQALEEERALYTSYLSSIVKKHETPFSRLNSAFLTDGIIIRINDNVEVKEPLWIAHFLQGDATPRVAFPRSLYIAGSNSRSTLVETFHSLNNHTTLTNVVSEVSVGANARLHHYRIQDESAGAFHISNTAIAQKQDSRYASVTFTFGGRIVRNNISTELNGQGIESILNGLYMGHDEQLIDNHTFIDHAQPHCESHELYRGILKDKARAVFSGKIMVRPDAQKTDAKQSNNCLLLSDDARINSKPQLEIYADDVKCTHGATVGQLDEEAAFYLRARGIPRHKATGILTYAFAEEIISGIEVEAVRDTVHRLLARQLGHEIDFTEF
ncbi:MAG: Fe-S cluster assembly protein SufD [Calditrichaeota bacterium]|nr:MAG: Fe-S cluster assembly protein SufD [Calditrichota bacterium]